LAVKWKSVCLNSLPLGIYYLLQSLGFVLNVNKSQLIPVTRILYLGFIIDTVSMTLLLPDEKIVKILDACHNLLTYMYAYPSVREVAHVIGLLVSAFPSVSFLKLHYRSIELCKFQALSVNPDFDQKIQLDPHAWSDLQWVIENISWLNASCLRTALLMFILNQTQVLQVGMQSAMDSWQMVDGHY